MNRHGACSHKKASQRGQSFLIIVIFVALILMAMLGIAADYTQVWAHRQMAQGAADAACQAAAADLYIKAIDSNALPSLNWIGTGFDCAGNTTPPCKYAAINGYTGSGISVSFPSSLPGVPALTGAFTSIKYPYVLVTISDPVAMSFTKLAGAPSTVTITAKAGCGLAPVNLPAPLVVLNQTGAGALSLRNRSITVTGGPQHLIEVNSNNTGAVDVGGSTIDLSHAGPSGTGGDFGVVGSETMPGGVTLGSTGSWLSPNMPYGDPFGGYIEPARPAALGAAFPVAFGVNGCPDTTGCTEFTAGDYSACSRGSVTGGGNACQFKPTFIAPYGSPWSAATGYANGAIIVPPLANNPSNFMFQATQAATATSGSLEPVWSTSTLNNSSGPRILTDGGVTWTNMGPINTSSATAIFDPGVYFLGDNGLPFNQNTARMSTATGDGSGGATFFFSSSGTSTFLGSSGNETVCGAVSAGSASWIPSCVVQYDINGGPTTGAAGWSVSNPPLSCPGGTNPASVPSTLRGNILLGPCTGAYGDSAGKTRGFLFWQGRATSANAQLGRFSSNITLSGFIYVHNNVSYGDTLRLQSGSTAPTFIIGGIVADQLSLGGRQPLNMILNPNFMTQQLRPSLLE
jgi:hypothetical protein